MRAFILRRVELVTAGVGDVVLIGSTHSAGTHRIKEFLMRNGHPYTFIDLELDPDVQNLLDSFHITASEIPVVICRGKVVLRNPNNQEIAVCLGFNEAIDQTQARDLVIIGAGPSGLAAAVYGASEGLDVLMLETSLAGRPGRFKLKNRKLLGISQRYLWSGARRLGRTTRHRSSARRCSSPRAPDSSATANRTSSKSKTELEFRHVP